MTLMQATINSMPNWLKKMTIRKVVKALVKAARQIVEIADLLEILKPDEVKSLASDARALNRMTHRAYSTILEWEKSQLS